MTEEPIFWYIEPLDDIANESIARELAGSATPAEVHGISDARGVSRNVYLVNFAVVRAVNKSRDIKKRVRFFRSRGINGQLEHFNLEDLRKRFNRRKLRKKIKKDSEKF